MQVQDGQCAGCGADFARYRDNVDHCHVTGWVRGLLCDSCNARMAAVDREGLEGAPWMLVNYVTDTPTGHGRWDQSERALGMPTSVHVPQHEVAEGNGTGYALWILVSNLFDIVIAVALLFWWSNLPDSRQGDGWPTVALIVGLGLIFLSWRNLRNLFCA